MFTRLAADCFNPFVNLSQKPTNSKWPIYDNIQTCLPNYVVKGEFFYADVIINDFPARSSLSGWSGQGKGKRKPNLGCRGAGRLNTRDKTRNLSLKEITETKGLTLFDLMPHMESSRWIDIYEGINMHLQKAYNTNKASFKAKHWKVDPQTRTYDVEAIRRARSKEITADEDPGRWLAFDETRQASDRNTDPPSTLHSLTPILFHGNTQLFDGYSLRWMRTDEEMRRLEATGTYTDDEINRLARRGKQRGHIPGVGRVLPARATAGPSTPASESTLNSLHKKVDFMMSLFKSDSKYSDMFSQFESGGASGSGGCGDDEESADAQEDEDEDGDGDS
ncbi:hypothetical protein Tco_1447516 [Tanacetum coccineum]